MLKEKKVKVGGGVDPELQLYIVRDDYDERLFQLLSEGEYANVLSSRQMGKTSLLNRTRARLREIGIRTAEIDLAAEMEGKDKDGKFENAEEYFAALLTSLARRLELIFDYTEFERVSHYDTPGQRFQRFFREIVALAISEPIVVFLDEIDSTLKHPFTDGLFTAIRGMCNERALTPVYRQFTFCLLGVASPNELIKDRRTTPYNIGETLGLRDFDAEQDDLAPLVAQLSPDLDNGWALLHRVLYWSGGQPYLTMKICREVQWKKLATPDAVDQWVNQTFFKSLNRLVSEDSHFEQLLKLIQDRFGNTTDSLVLYQRVLRGERLPDQTTLPYIHLKLSGLVKRDGEGLLIVRNPIYRQLFDETWLASQKPMQAQHRLAVRYRLVKIALVIMSGIALIMGAAWGFRELQLRQPIHTDGNDYWVTIPPGGFCMGSRLPDTVQKDIDPRCADSPVDKDASTAETPLRWVTIAKPFLLARHETTVEEYQHYTYDEGLEPPPDYGFGRDLSGEQRKNLPVVDVSWNDAQAYAAWLSKKTGRTYRLPTEAEWEYAARAGTQQVVRYWEAGPSPQAICQYANLADQKAKSKNNTIAWAVHCDDGYAETAPVGSYPDNPWGLSDMLGNVWEWTADCWHDSYEGAPADGKAWLKADGEDCGQRVYRSGSWVNRPESLRAASRFWYYPDTRDNGLGFRLAQDP